LKHVEDGRRERLGEDICCLHGGRNGE